MERFHELPVLVRCKIMRKLSPLAKAWSLYPVSEFRPLLDESQSWTNSSEASFFQKLLPVLTLPPGFYFSKHDWSSYGIRVSSDDLETLSFSIFHFHRKRHKPDWFSAYYFVQFNFVSNLVAFANDVRDNYVRYDDRDVAAYHWKGFGWFFLNRKTDQVLWTDDTLKEMLGVGKNKCHFHLSPGKKIMLSTSGDDVLVRLYDFGRGKRRECRLEPTPMEEAIRRALFEFSFKTPDRLIPCDEASQRMRGDFVRAADSALSHLAFKLDGCRGKMSYEGCKKFKIFDYNCNCT